MQHQRFLLGGIVALAAVGLVPGPSAIAATPPSPTETPAPEAVVDDGAASLAETTSAEAGRSVTIFSGTSSATATTFWNVGHGGPGNLVAPVNYAGGKAVLKLNVLSKPSTKRLSVQVCMWRNNYQQETCSPGRSITGTGSYTFDLGRPSGWWKKGSFSWATPYQVTHIMVKDPATGRLMMSRNCGAACYRGSDLSRHVPIRMSGTLTFTA